MSTTFLVCIAVWAVRMLSEGVGIEVVVEFAPSDQAALPGSRQERKRRAMRSRFLHAQAQARSCSAR